MPTSTTPEWTDLHTHQTLWHGCLDSDARAIQDQGINLTRSRLGLDFGSGFYTTTSRAQAIEWAIKRYGSLPPIRRNSFRPAILRFELPLDRLARLESLVFIRSDADHSAYWAFVRYCRRSTSAKPRTHLHPGRLDPPQAAWYDLVCGPVATIWTPTESAVLLNSDQFSFHTDAGIAILNDVIRAGSPHFQALVL